MSQNEGNQSLFSGKVSTIDDLAIKYKISLQNQPWIDRPSTKRHENFEEDLYIVNRRTFDDENIVRPLITIISKMIGSIWKLCHGILSPLSSFACGTNSFHSLPLSLSLCLSHSLSLSLTICLNQQSLLVNDLDVI